MSVAWLGKRMRRARGGWGREGALEGRESGPSPIAAAQDEDRDGSVTWISVLRPPHPTRVARLNSPPGMGLAPRTLIIIVVCAVLGVIILLAIFYRIIITSCRRSRASPLPPIQPLSYEREHQRAQFEASRSRNSAFLTPTHLPPLGSLSPGGSKTSLLGSFKSPRASCITTTAEGAEELFNSSPLDPVTPVPRMPASSSSVNLSSSPSPLRQSSRPSRDDRQRRQPTSLSLSRSLPHARHSQVQIILPTPLGTSILPTLHRQSMYELDAARDRTSIVDRWVSAGRDCICLSRSTCTRLQT